MIAYSISYAETTNDMKICTQSIPKGDSWALILVASYGTRSVRCHRMTTSTTFARTSTTDEDDDDVDVFRTKETIDVTVETRPN